MHPGAVDQRRACLSFEPQQINRAYLSQMWVRNGESACQNCQLWEGFSTFRTVVAFLVECQIGYSRIPTVAIMLMFLSTSYDQIV
jgi:hypothetical protein